MPMWMRKENLQLSRIQKFKYLKKSHKYTGLFSIMVAVHPFRMTVWVGDSTSMRKKVSSFWTSVLKSVLSTCFQAPKLYFCYATLILSVFCMLMSPCFLPLIMYICIYMMYIYIYIYMGTNTMSVSEEILWYSTIGVHKEIEWGNVRHWMSPGFVSHDKSSQQFQRN